MRGGREKQNVAIRLGRQAFGKLVALRLFGLGGASAGPLGVGRAFVRFIQDDQIPALLPDALADVVLLGIVE